jgi:IS5 family transposase
MFCRHAVVLSLALSACAPQTRAHTPTFQAVRETPRQGEKPHTKISPAGATGIAVLGALLVGAAGVAFFVIPRTGSAG